ncbi:Neurogenic locus Notch protein [Stylophora pistillata]|uniref:Neurogenic locus Notch protein n=1 Tax=Stylophora pistillata TaxID=50429 RepID=A0A2B4SEB6_STYPI|nr:Neurogenic locus Notch protein [Stylophora pistillata]
MVTLQWIRGSSSFAANCASEIQSTWDPHHWKHCSGEDNPADLLTHGVPVNVLADSKLWWSGPCWLPSQCLPEQREFPNELTESVEKERKQRVTRTCALITMEPLIDPSRYEQWLTLVRVTAFVLRGVRAFKSGISAGSKELSAEELQDAKLRWYREIEQEKRAPLPSERVSLSPAFTHVGVDFAGPLFVRGSASPEKAYICIFTCASSSMTHPELTGDLSTNEFLQAFLRMISRRRLCRNIWSDNAKTFKRADREIQQLFTQGSSVNKGLWDRIDQEELQAKSTTKGIKWKFIVERFPWHGGWWERLVRSVKEPLRKILGKALLSYQELATILTRIEAVIKSRPLTTVSDDIRDLTPITPAPLAIGRSLFSSPDFVDEFSANKSTTRQQYLYQQKLIKHFWQRWRGEYLHQLSVRKKWTKKGLLRRLVQRLHRLEASSTQFGSGEFVDSGAYGGERVTRKVKKRAKKKQVTRKPVSSPKSIGEEVFLYLHDISTAHVPLLVPLINSDIDECSSNPCLNRGVCNDQVNGYVCTCPAGYTGLHCETDIHECSSNPCLNGGTCTDQVNGYLCSCIAMYIGLRCETVRVLDIHFRSEGCDDPGTVDGCGKAYIKVDGTDYSLQRRGHNVVVVNGETGVFLEARAFDTHADSSSGNNLRDYLNSLSGNKIVLVATQDSAASYMSPAIDALKRLGATDPLQANYRDSFTFSGYSGVNKPQWITQKREDRYQGPSEIFPHIPLSVNQ